MILILIAILISYVVGSLCSAVIVSQICHLPDPREEGSRNPGTTNVLRIAGKKYALIVLLADLLKGFIPVVIVKWLSIAPNYLGYVALAAVLGHIYPIFFKFKGGKGVATALGVLLGLNWILGLAVVATWLLVAFIFRYSSLAAMIALILAPLYTVFISSLPHIVLPLIILAIIVLYQHRGNMVRLIQGKESKIKL